MTGHAVVIGYGTKGRSVVTTLEQAGLSRESIVVVDAAPEVISEANVAGLVAITGDATRREVLLRAKADSAAQVVIAVNRDDSAILIALTARQLSPSATIVAAVREEENEALLRQSGADQVIVSSATAGRLLGISTVRPAAGQVISDLLDRSRGLGLTERAVSPAELGSPASGIPGPVIAVMRGDQVLACDDPLAGRLASGDRLIMIGAREADGRYP